MTPKEAEALVRERWERVYGGGEIAVTVYAEEKACHFLNYIAAAEFTKQREEKIRQKREEIHLVRGWRFTIEGNAAALRILAVLEVQLAALLVGWREDEEPKP